MPIAKAAASPRLPVTKPRLLFFYSPTSGVCRRVEGFLAGVLQRRHNHDAFDVVFVDTADHPELGQRYGVTAVPTLIVVDEDKPVARSDGPWGCRQITDLLAPWLR